MRIPQNLTPGYGPAQIPVLASPSGSLAGKSLSGLPEDLVLENSLSSNISRMT
jgi:hypothetical protein